MPLPSEWEQGLPLEQVKVPSEWEQGLPLEQVKVPSGGKKTAVLSGEHTPPPPTQDLHISSCIWPFCNTSYVAGYFSGKKIEFNSGELGLTYTSPSVSVSPALRICLSMHENTSWQGCSLA